MAKCLAKVGHLEVWETESTRVVSIKGLHLENAIHVTRTEFFLFEKLLSKVVRGFLNGQ